MLPCRNLGSILARVTAITPALVFSAISAAPAMASGHTILRENVKGILPLTDPVNPSPVIAGVSPAGAGTTRTGRAQGPPRRSLRRRSLG
jgi:hypothetical protein